MTLKESLTMIIITVCIGVPLSLCIRIKRENISFKDYGTMINLMIKFLIIYPFILFPIITYFTKNTIAENVAIEILKKNNGINKSKKEIKNEILQNFNLKFTFKVWRFVLKDMFLDYDGYIDENISLARKIIKERKTAKNKTYEHKKDSKFIHFKYYQKEVIRNTNVKDIDKAVFC